MKELPLVSVVVPCYNRAAVLEQSVRSVLAQSYAELELILVDDGSTDRTRQVVGKIKDARLRYVYQQNAGACAARNYGAALARGEYIAFHDSDDVWHSDKLEKQMRVMQEKHPDIVVCKMKRFNADGSTVLYPKRISEGFISAKDDLFGIGTQTILARREVLKAEQFFLGNAPVSGSRMDLPRTASVHNLLHGRADGGLLHRCGFHQPQRG